MELISAGDLPRVDRAFGVLSFSGCEREVFDIELFDHCCLPPIGAGHTFDRRDCFGAGHTGWRLSVSKNLHIGAAACTREIECEQRWLGLPAVPVPFQPLRFERDIA